MLRKTLISFGTLLSVIIIVFILFQWLGNPEHSLSGQSADKKTIEQIRRSFHLDEPVWKRCMRFINDLSPISVYSQTDINEKNITGIFWGGQTKWGIKFPYLGISFLSKKKVSQLLMDSFPATLLLAFSAMLFALVVGLMLGIMAGWRQDKLVDQFISSFSMLGISAPSFFVALLFAYLFGFLWHQYTGLDLSGGMYEINELTGERSICWSHLILPALTLGIRPLAVITQVTRTSLIDALHMDYIRTAKAKGCGSNRIIFYHAVPNLIRPVAISASGWFAELLAGAFFVEFIFGWNGMGRVTVNALEKMDFPVVIGAVLLSASFFITVNLLTDYFISRNDRRIQEA